MNETEKKFYLEIKESVDDYLNSFRKVISEDGSDLEWSSNEESYRLLCDSHLSSEQKEAIENIAREICVGVLHSLFVSIDGGTALSDEGKALELIDRKTGKPLTEGALHENFMDVFV